MSDAVARPETTRAMASLDPTWARIRAEAEALAHDEPVMGSIAHSAVLHHGGFEQALAFRIASKLATAEMSPMMIRELVELAMAQDSGIGAAARADLTAVFERDPACTRLVQPLLYFKGFLAIQCHRVAHQLWKSGRRDIALYIQMRVSEMFSIDIHPAARIGRGIMIDHAHSMVIGETAVVGNDVSMLHGVTLGGTGKTSGDRHPKIGDGVLIGAGAKVLGNIKVGHCSRVAAGSVVLKDVPPNTTVAGIPAKKVGEAGCDRPSHAMDHQFGWDRPLAEDIVPDC
ncbi:MAG: serine O-acetyltransferase [Pseudomonadota bacterium]